METKTAQHTPGPWRLEERGEYLDTYIMAGEVDIIELALVDANPEANIANAERIVACVNACNGISTERLEEVSFPLAEYAELREQNQDLLGALRECAECLAASLPPAGGRTERTFLRAIAVIAKAEPHG